MISLDGATGPAPLPEALPAPASSPDPAYAYWAADTDDVGSKLVSKIQNHEDAKLIKQLQTLWGRAYQYYHGIDPSGVHATSQVLRKGDQDELAAIRVNHSRALVNTLHNIITASKVSWTPKATNIDYESIQQCELAAAVLEYYFAEHSVSYHSLRALEEAIVFGEGFVLLEWEAEAGDEYSPDGESLAKSGDAVFRNVSAWDVIRDPTKTSWKHLDWVIVRVWRNKYDLMSKYPGAEEKINGAGGSEVFTKSRRADVNRREEEDSDDVPVYYFFHRRTPALPSGRQVIFLGNKLVLEDSELELSEIPLYRVASSDLIGSPFGYTTYWDILGVQELMDSLHTAAATNQSTLATQMIAIPKGSSIDPDDIGGMKVVYYETGDQPPSALQLTKTPPEVFTYLESLKGDQRLLMGLNSVVQGETPSGELSGSALALLDAKALQQSAVIQSNYLRMLERLGAGLLELFRKRADVPKAIAVVGQSSRYLVTEQTYSAETFARIKSVRVELGNPLAQHPAGRYEMAKELAQLGLARTPEEVQQVLTTGQLKPLTQSLQNELTLIQAENQQLLQGQDPPTLILDDHLLHAREHRAVLANPEARKNPQIVQAILQHISEHENLYYSAPPTTLMLVGQQPPMLPAAGAPPGAPSAAGEAPGIPGNPAAGKPPSRMPSQPKNPSTGERKPPPPQQQSPTNQPPPIP